MHIQTGCHFNLSFTFPVQFQLFLCVLLYSRDDGDGSLDHEILLYEIMGIVLSFIDTEFLNFGGYSYGYFGKSPYLYKEEFNPPGET